MAASVFVLGSNAVMAAGFLDKLKDIESAISSPPIPEAPKAPKISADVGGVKLDPTKCSVKTGVKVADNASKEKTDGKCGNDKETPQKVSAPAKQEVVDDNDFGLDSRD